MNSAILLPTLLVFVLSLSCSEESFKGSSNTVDPNTPTPSPYVDTSRDSNPNPNPNLNPNPNPNPNPNYVQPIPVDCTNDPTNSNQELFQSVPSQSTWGHNGSKSGRRAYAPQGHIIRELLNSKCNAGISTGYMAGMVSADKTTRDAVCQLYGYLKATDNFTSWVYASPRDNSIAYFQGNTIIKSPNAKSYNNGHLLGAVECIGKVAPDCNGQILNPQNLVCN